MHNRDKLYNFNLSMPRYLPGYFSVWQIRGKYLKCMVFCSELGAVCADNVNLPHIIACMSNLNMEHYFLQKM